MSNLNNRLKQLENRQGPQDGAESIVVTYAVDNPGQVTVNGRPMTRAELNEYEAAHNAIIVYLPGNGRESVV